MPPRTPRGLRRTAIAAVSTFVAISMSILVAPTPAHADPSAADLAREVEQQGQALSATVEQYNTVNVLLGRTSAQLADVQARIPGLTARVDQAESAAATVASSAYKGSTASGFEAMLDAGSPGDLIDRMDTLSALSRSQQRDLAALRAAREQLQAQQAKLDTLVAQQTAQHNDLATKKASIEAKIASLKKQQDELAWRQAAQAAAGRRPSTPSTGGTVSGPPPPVSGRAAAVVSYAYAQLGKPYVFGAAGPGVFDCSGLVMMAWAQAGVHLEHSSYIQMNEETVHIPRSALQPGDIVFFEGGGHEGLYIGNGNVIHAPHTGDVVKISSIDWIGSYTVAGRVR